MKNVIILLLLLIPRLTYSQIDEKNDYAIYQKIINEHLNFGISEKVDSLVLIEKFEPKFPPELDIITELTADSISSWTMSYLSILTYNNE